MKHSDINKLAYKNIFDFHFHRNQPFIVEMMTIAQEQQVEALEQKWEYPPPDFEVGLCLQ